MSACTGSGGSEIRVAGCDLGKATAKFAVGRLVDGGRIAIDETDTVHHGGNPLDAFCDWYRRMEVASCAALGATGIDSGALVAPAISGLPAEACLEAGLRLLPGLDGPLNVVSVGARGYSVLSRSADGRVQYLENEKCSSGTGETMVKIAARFGLSIEEADALAYAATETIPITARCSVFAKSEMTHFGNQGRPADQLFRGYFTSVANYTAALLARARVDGPVLVVGGGALLRAFVRGLEESLDREIIVPENPLHLEAMGACALASDQLGAAARLSLPDDPAALVRVRERQFRVLEPARNWRHRVTTLEATAPRPGAERAPSILGLDLGSTGSKAVLTEVDSGEPVLDLYDRTRGNPVDAARRLVAALLDRCRPDIRAIGVTGSGREAVATVLRAAYPELGDRIVVINEIVAHATAAIRCDEARGESLSVVEIGGQDAKFIQVRDGKIVESDMNKACSAGTGSFLEEQAVFYGVDDIERFTQIAQRAERPPDLGQMCTVFVAGAAAEAAGQGFELADLFGGFQYSVIFNYINRVMGQRTFGDRIFFQGKPATGPSLAWTLAAITDRDVVVPANPGAMGAWGIGLCALGEVGREGLRSAASIDLRVVLGAEVVAQSEFQCKDKRCATLCTIARTKVAVGDKKETVFSGGACPKYEISTAARPKLAKDAPSAFDERAALLAPFLEDVPGDRVVALPLVGACHGYFPWLVTFLKELGLGVRILRPDRGSLARGEANCYSFDACAPIKIAHGVASTDADTIFLPKVLTLGDRDDCSGKTCPMEQGLPEMIREALRARGSQARVVHPRFSFEAASEPLQLMWQAQEAASMLGVGRRQGLRAARAASEAQQRYEQSLAEIGQCALDYAREHSLPVVVVCGSLHVIHDRGVNANIPGLLRENGVLPLPMDCYPIPAGIHPMPRIRWAEARRALRVSVSARERGDVYPLLLSSFGCGPASFVEQIFADLMAGHPFTALESDGHGGAAGYVTRVQAFLHTVRKHDGASSAVARSCLRILEELPMPDVTEEEDAQIVFLRVGDRLTSAMAAAYRSIGIDAVTAERSSPEVLASGRRDCSGKECLPYQLIWGAFRKHLEEPPPTKRTVLVDIAGQGPCRNCMFTIKDQLSVARLGLADKVALRHLRTDSELGWRFTLRLYASVVSWDILFQLSSYHRAFERHEGEVDRLYNRYCDELEALVSLGVNDSGMRGLRELRRHTKALHALLDRASEEFAALASSAPEDGSRRTVLLSGDIYIRLDEFANDQLIRRLNQRGLSVLVEPSSIIQEYFTDESLLGFFGAPSATMESAVSRFAMRAVRYDLYGRVRRLHPWLPETDLRAMQAARAELLDEYPKGEAAITLGSVLHAWNERHCDGAVVASPWGCAPALVTEALLRHRREIPILFVYCDGSPIDPRRLNGFAFRLKRRPRRCGPAPVWVPNQPRPSTQPSALR